MLQIFTPLPYLVFETSLGMNSCFDMHLLSDGEISVLQGSVSCEMQPIG